ncbi:hypothetical protein SADUNF_Sadunf10G0008100 [Salix dunnii]|uniref:PPIase cyclophilin-type domain-containing protein n=1 Tax=Salix dunnii TaxID=1413687 RepID=A0A835MXL4_9ROSI|nr:hypothetical protein SADUNF_Sadunf10G0008100 [Salix dunnii]
MSWAPNLREKRMMVPWWVVSFASVALVAASSSQDPQLGSARVVFQTNYGDIEFGFFPSVAPQTVDHIFKLVRLGCYNTNHFFRILIMSGDWTGLDGIRQHEILTRAETNYISCLPNTIKAVMALHFFQLHVPSATYKELVVDKGFVAQVADVVGGRSAPMNEEQRKEAKKTVVGEFSEVKHVRGILSMGRYCPRFDDPNSAQSSFSMLLGNAPHLDGHYAIFGKVTKGDDTLTKLEQLPTRKEGIFVMHSLGNTQPHACLCCYVAVTCHMLDNLEAKKNMNGKKTEEWKPTERITILSSYYYDTEMESCEEEKSVLKRRLAASAVEVERQPFVENICLCCGGDALKQTLNLPLLSSISDF